MQVLIEPLRGEAILKSIKLIYHLIRLLMDSSKKSLFRACSPNGSHVTCVCSRCLRRKQNCHHFFVLNAFITGPSSYYRDNIVPQSMYHFMVSAVIQISTL